MRISDWSSDVCSSDLPDYEGSDDYEVAPLPLLSVNYRDIVFLDKTTTLGANVFTLRGPGPNDKLHFGPLLRYQFGRDQDSNDALRSEEHTSELQSLMRISYAVFCLKKKNKQNTKR